MTFTLEGTTTHALGRHGLSHHGVALGGAATTTSGRALESRSESCVGVEHGERIDHDLQSVNNECCV